MPMEKKENKTLTNQLGSFFNLQYISNSPHSLQPLKQCDSLQENHLGMTEERHSDGLEFLNKCTVWLRVLLQEFSDPMVDPAVKCFEMQRTWPFQEPQTQIRFKILSERPLVILPNGHNEQKGIITLLPYYNTVTA